MKKIAAIILSITFFFLINSSVAQASETEPLSKKKEYIENLKNDLHKKKQTEESNLKNTVNQKKTLEQKHTKELNDYSNLSKKGKQFEDELYSLDENLKQLETKHKEQKELLEKQLRVMYENSDYIYLETLTRSKSPSDFFIRWEALSVIAKKNKDLIDSFKVSKQDIDYKRKEKESENSRAKDELKSKQSTLNNTKASISILEKEASLITQKINQLNRQEDQLLKESLDLEKKIKNMQNDQKYSGGTMQWPVPSSHSISSYFGMRTHPVTGATKMHTGIDIPAHEGSSIIAANGGIVIISGWQGGYGYLVAIDHGGGISTLYGHCSKLLVSQSAKVQEGDVIAKVGSTGISTGPHLHFEVRKNGTPVNPLGYVKN